MTDLSKIVDTSDEWIVERTGIPAGMGIYGGTPGAATLRFSITRRTDGRISLSGMWPGMTAL